MNQQNWKRRRLGPNQEIHLVEDNDDGRQVSALPPIGILGSVSPPIPSYAVLIQKVLDGPDSTTVALAAEHLCSRIKATSSEDLGAFWRLRGDHALVSAIRLWPWNEDIQTPCLCCLASLLKRSYTATRVFSLRRMGAMELVVEAMKMFPSSVKLQVCGMATMGNLLAPGFMPDSGTRRTHNGTTSSNQAKREAIRAAEVAYVNFVVDKVHIVSILIAAMHSFHDSESCQVVGCFVLSRLSMLLGPRAKMVMTKTRGVEIVARSVQTFPHNNRLEKYARMFMNKVLPATSA